jgi:hypothetical protein
MLARLQFPVAAMRPFLLLAVDARGSARLVELVRVLS